MGSFDGTELRELIVIFMLSLIGKKCNPDNIGLYRDDRLTVFKNTSASQSEKIRKTFQKMFKNKGLHIIIKYNLKIFNYLDVTLNLNNGSYHPYKDLYIHVNLDHPPSILKELPMSTEKRLLSFSLSKEIFKETALYSEQYLFKLPLQKKVELA